MKKLVCLLAIAALSVGTALAYDENLYDGNPGNGVINSSHDINTLSGLERDDQGRVCAFCHTPHHAEDLGGEYNPLWAHTPSTVVGQPYESATYDADDEGFVDPLIGPSRLCMSCHDGMIAPDQHYGNLFPGTPIAGTFPYGSDAFGGIAVGLGGNFTNDHPIGFNVANVSDTGLVANIWDGAQFASNLKNVVIGEQLFKNDANERYFTCATCHDVHNQLNVRNDDTGLWLDQTDHRDDFKGNYFVYSPQSGSQLCLSCHNK